jgi:endonuclease/exonuclease/phosphatase family metal-dependent hydrolase
MRIVTWNCRRATNGHLLWDYLEELAPDVAFLQEVGTLPVHRFTSYDLRTGTPRTKAGGLQRFATVLLVRGTIGEAVHLGSSHQWVNQQLEHFAGNVLAFEVTVHDGRPLTVVNVYSPAWPVDRAAYLHENVEGIKLKQSPHIWLTDLVTETLRSVLSSNVGDWVVGGDFNSCVTFDNWRGGPRGNQEWLGRMAALGFLECLRHYQGQVTPTFRGPGKMEPNCQIDKIFVSQTLATRLEHCCTGKAERVFDQHLSDHLPVVADFVSPSRGAVRRTGNLDPIDS